MRLQNYFEKFRIQILLGGLKKFLLHFWSPVETISLCPTLFIHLPYSRINGWQPRNSIFKLIISEWCSDTLESALTEKNLENWWKLENVHLPPPSPLSLLRHVDTSPVFPHEAYEQWDWLCELTRNTFLSELWEVRPKYWKVSIWKQYVLHRQGIWKCQNFFNIPTANKEMWRTRIILSFGTSPQKILGGIE